MIPAYALVEGIQALPSLPESVARLTPLLRDERASSGRFEQAVRSDPAITANLLKAANSAYFSGNAPVSTVREAVARIGLRRVYEVAVSTSFRQTLPRRLPGYGLNGSDFWLHCTATALFAEALAVRGNHRCADIAYIAGLLHDAGKLIIGGFLAVEVPEANWWTFGTDEGERQLLGSSHCDVGKEIARKWNLPLQVEQACRWHHEPGRALTEEQIELASVVHAADALAYRAGFPGGSSDGPDLDPAVALRLGLTPESLDRLIEEKKEEILHLGEVSSPS